MVYAMPEGYNDILTARSRSVEAFISVGSNLDLTVIDDIMSITGDFLPMSNTAQAYDANYSMTPGLATFEGYGIKTAQDAGTIAPPIAPMGFPPETGLWSAGISDADGHIDWTFTITLSRVHKSALTIYTHDQNILEGQAKYSRSGAVVKTAPLVTGDGSAVEAQGCEYDSVQIIVSKISAAYAHVKVTEVEFGASESYGKYRLCDRVTLIQQCDLSMQSIPLYELDFSVLNVHGEYDPDNPDANLQRIRQGYPATLAYTISTPDGATKFTVPSGKFQIQTRSSGIDEVLDVTAFDPRAALIGNRRGLVLSTAQSFGALFTSLFEELHISAEVETSLFSLFPVSDVTIPGDAYDLLDILLLLEQRYDIWVTPARGNVLHVTQAPDFGSYGTMLYQAMVSFPHPSLMATYNMVQIVYGDTGGQVYTLDLRTDQSAAVNPVSIDNPLIITAAEAEALAHRVARGLYSEAVSVDWRGDPALDVMDRIGIAGRWTKNSPTEYITTRIQVTYDGGLASEVMAVRGVLG